MGRSVYIVTFGCQMNCRDSETMAAALEDGGYQIVSEREADAIVINSCSVREEAERKAVNGLRRAVARKKNRPDFLVGVAGCMAQRLGGELLQLVPGLDFVLGTGNFHRVAEALDRAESGEGPLLLLSDGGPYGYGGRRRKIFRPTAHVSITTGCPMRCSYCIVPKVRGLLRSRPMGDILAEIAALADEGTKEVVLLGQIVNRYGFREFPTLNGKSPFVQLLEKVHEINGIERIRFLSPHPCGFREDLLNCFLRLPKLCRGIHLPIQSGSDRILRAMGRGYGRESALSILRWLREMMPDCALSTDLIVGFPGESEEDFQKTEKLFDEIDFDMAYLFKFSPRDGTAAAQLPGQLSEELVVERHRRLLARLAVTSLRRNELFIGTVQFVLAEGPSRKDRVVLVGHTQQGKKIFFRAPQEVVGSIVPVAVTGASVAALTGELA
ncbi:MAG: tRNA (N6-isopentenyl adenosine(37)-C2)-methylthiotransferase MiaB [Puniceicoccales bacterium]|jgi:tRNA-2-methylthio-N6-dimethylallyladenosine synthase|nr:tRNA (N6-isopentenyl adenosine(37)-C2)-methylthiotransferase MiaB [Puniceicoccales bacterium]